MSYLQLPKYSKGRRVVASQPKSRKPSGSLSPHEVGRLAGEHGFLPDANPYPRKSREARQWEQGRRLTFKKLNEVFYHENP